MNSTITIITSNWFR